MAFVFVFCELWYIRPFYQMEFQELTFSGICWVVDSWPISLFLSLINCFVRLHLLNSCLNVPKIRSLEHRNQRSQAKLPIRDNVPDNVQWGYRTDIAQLKRATFWVKFFSPCTSTNNQTEKQQQKCWLFWNNLEQTRIIFTRTQSRVPQQRTTEPKQK